MRKYFIIAYVIIGILVSLTIAISFDIKGLGGLTMLKTSLRKGGSPELDGGLEWFNTKMPIKLSDLRGKLVLLDFWTYCCINCMHVIPDLKRLERQYPDELVVIGVHSAKFTNEAESENIRQAILRYEIKHPVVNDANFAIWKRYSVNAWPTLVLINPEGYIIGYYSGEGNYELINSKISQTITEFRERGMLDEKPISFDMESKKVVSGVLSFPGKVIADELTNRLFIADSNHNRIVITDLDGRVIEVVGDGIDGKGDGNFSESSFNHPQGMALKGNTLFVADTENHLIRRLDLDKKMVTTIAGTGEQAGFMAQGGEGLTSSLNSPWDLTLVEDKLYIAMAGSHQIWVMDLAAGLVQPYAGSGHEGRIDGPLPSSALAQPSGITTDGKMLFFADSEVSSIRSVDLGPDGRVKTIVGLDLFVYGDKDGVGDEVRLQHPLGILYHEGMIYIADTYNHKIKVVDPKDRSCKTILGTGDPGHVDGKAPEFYEPGGLAVAKGKLYIADTNNHAIRVADLGSMEVTTLQISGLLKIISF